MYDVPFKSFDKESIIPEYNIIDWDLVVNGEPYSVARMNGFVHTQGGKWGNNDLWAWPRGQEPNYHNLIPFNSKYPVTWGLEYIEYNKSKYHEHDWGDDSEIDAVCGTWITRNGKRFYFVRGDMECSLPRAQSLIFYINEGPINFNSINWSKNLVGRKIWYNDEPAIVESLWFDENEGYHVFIVPDGIEKFSCPKSWLRDGYLRDSWSDYENGLSYNIINPEYNKVDWFRN